MPCCHHQFNLRPHDHLHDQFRNIQVFWGIMKDNLRIPWLYSLYGTPTPSTSLLYAVNLSRTQLSSNISIFSMILFCTISTQNKSNPCHTLQGRFPPFLLSYLIDFSCIFDSISYDILPLLPHNLSLEYTSEHFRHFSFQVPSIIYQQLRCKRSWIVRFFVFYNVEKTCF